MLILKFFIFQITQAVYHDGFNHLLFYFTVNFAVNLIRVKTLTWYISGEEVRFKVPTETVKVKREPKVKKEPAEPKAPRAPAVKKEKKEANGEPQPMSLADRMKKKRKSSPMKPKKNPWETDSEEDDDISDFSGVSGDESDGDFRPVTKKAKSATNGAAVKLEPDISLGKSN